MTEAVGIFLTTDHRMCRYKKAHKDLDPRSLDFFVEELDTHLQKMFTSFLTNVHMKLDNVPYESLLNEDEIDEIGSSMLLFRHASFDELKTTECRHRVCLVRMNRTGDVFAWVSPEDDSARSIWCTSRREYVNSFYTSTQLRFRAVFNICCSIFFGNQAFIDTGAGAGGISDSFRFISLNIKPHRPVLRVRN